MSETLKGKLLLKVVVFQESILGGEPPTCVCWQGTFKWSKLTIFSESSSLISLLYWSNAGVHSVVNEEDEEDDNNDNDQNNDEDDHRV